MKKESIFWYFKNRRGFSPKFNPDFIKYDKNGWDGITSFNDYVDRGKITPTCHPRIVKALVRGMGATNFQIKEWAEGMSQGYILKIELEEYLKEIKAPTWVLRAVNNLRYKIIFENNIEEIVFNETKHRFETLCKKSKQSP